MKGRTRISFDTDSYKLAHMITFAEEVPFSEINFVLEAVAVNERLPAGGAGQAIRLLRLRPCRGQRGGRGGSGVIRFIGN